MSPATAARSPGPGVSGTRSSARAGAASAHPRAPARPAPSASRRVSGPARATAPVQAAPFSPEPLRLRLAPALARIPDHRLLDRMVRGRLWIGCIAFALLGIVAMQLSLLKLNTGIGRAFEHEALLGRQNAALRYDVSNLSAGDRVETQAVRMGMTMASPGAIHFLSASGSAQFRRAARSLDASAPVSPSSGSGAPAVAGSTATASAGSTTAPSASSPTAPSASSPTAASASSPTAVSGVTPSSGSSGSSGASPSSGASTGAGG